MSWLAACGPYAKRSFAAFGAGFRRWPPRVISIPQELPNLRVAEGWSTLNHYDCATRQLEWWPKMMQLAQLTQPGGMFSVPHLRASRGRLIPIKPTR